ncbi:MAG: anti-sigma factor [Alphaproteobacteria bacterium]
MSMEEDKDGFAAEYVLGTLDAEERAQADALTLVDTAFAASVHRWERRLGELTTLVAPVEPPAPVWESIKSGLASAGQAGVLHLPEVPASPVSAERVDAPGAEIIHMRQRMQRWRGFSAITGLMAACLVGIVLVREYKPEVLPPELRPQRPVQVVTQVVEKPVEVVKEVVREVPAPRPAQLVAVFQKDEQSPAFLLTVDVDKRMVTVRPVAAEKMADKTYQLWIAAQPGQAPRSLGLIGNDEFTVRAALSDYDPAVISNATFGISLEPLGGSPTGQPTGPVIHARLVQATP